MIKSATICLLALWLLGNSSCNSFFNVSKTLDGTSEFAEEELLVRDIMAYDRTQKNFLLLNDGKSINCVARTCEIYSTINLYERLYKRGRNLPQGQDVYKEDIPERRVRNAGSSSKDVLL